LLAQRQRFDSVNNTNLSQSQQLQQQLSASTSHFQANAGPSYPFGATAYASDYHVKIISYTVLISTFLYWSGSGKIRNYLN